MLSFVVHAEGAVEAALLDLMGQFLGLPVCALFGNGQQREAVRTLGYLFCVEDARKSPEPYIMEDDSPVAWRRVRRHRAMTPEAIIEQAAAKSVDAPIPLTLAVLEMMKVLHKDGDGSSDHSALIKYYQKLTGEALHR